MTGRGTNGLLPLENYAEKQKCPENPTKRQYPDLDTANRIAAQRTREAKMHITAYLCDGCGLYHLTSKGAGDKKPLRLPDGTLSTPALEDRRKQEIVVLTPPPELAQPEEEVDPESLPLVLGNKNARMKALVAFLKDKDETTTKEVRDLLGLTRQGCYAYLRELGWTTSMGNSASWVRNDGTERESSNFEVFRSKTDRGLKALDAALTERMTITTQEALELSGLGVDTVRSHLRDLGWTMHLGRKAHWNAPSSLTPEVTPVEVVEEVVEPAPKLVNVTPIQAEKAQAFANAELEASISRHPASQLSPWTDFQSDRVRHIPLGDIIDTLEAAGLEVSLRTRRARS